MSIVEIRTDGLPSSLHEGLSVLASTLHELAGEALLGLTAFGGKVAGDPFFAPGPTRSAAVLSAIDLRMLDRLASRGAALGKKNVSAPLIMTPEYIKASCDTFPLELIEIQQHSVLLIGQDFFSGAELERSSVRLQCERDLKSALLGLRQGLLVAAGRYARLGDTCLAVAEGVLRVCRGLVWLAGESPAPPQAVALVRRAGEVAGVKLELLARLVAAGEDLGFSGFQQFYAEVEALAAYADGMPGK